ncbi:MAG: cytochrome c3 family protein, partial [Duodenibacillus sp.]|nr:cytochrome c3 family protein [Duodenibacillus sp.]
STPAPPAAALAGQAFAQSLPPLAERHAAKGLPCAGCHQENPPAKRVKTAKCQSCHGAYETLAKRTATMQPSNVHMNHLGDLECKDCHQGHKADKLACAECHQFQFKMPK